MVFVENLLYMSRDSFGLIAYLFIGIFLFLESFPFLGSLIPGGLIGLLICGFLVKLGYFSFWKVYLVCMIALTLVDCLGYALGRKRKRGFLHRKRKFFLIKNCVIERVYEIVHGHTGKALIAGKLNPITRSIAPFIVGNERVSFFRFLLFSLIGSIIFVGIFLFMGWSLGSSYEVVIEAEHYILWIGAVLLTIFYVYYLGNLFKEYFGRKLNGNCK